MTKLSTSTIIVLTVLCALYPLAAAPFLTYGIFEAFEAISPVLFSFSKTLFYIPLPDTSLFVALMYAQVVLAVALGAYLLHALYRRRQEGKATARQLLYPAIAFGFFVAFALLSYVFLPLTA